jgi:hypothetical protein
MFASRYAPTIAMLTALAVLSACNPFANKQKVGQIDPKHAQSNTEWNGTLSTPAGMSGAVDMRGTASLAGNGPGASLATVAISNAAPKGVHPWEVYRGQCGNDGDLIGAFSAYPALIVNNDGTATASAKLRAELPVTGDFHVNVNASAANMTTVIACGNLAAPSGT